MDLPNTLTKLEDARTMHAELMRASDPVKFRSAFGAFINNCRAVTYAMQAEGSKDEAFMLWYRDRQEEMRGDELIRFVHDARIEDFHKGLHQLEFSSSTSARGLDPGTVMSLNPGAFQGNEDGWSFTLGSDGLFTTMDKGTSKEHRVMLSQAMINTKISIRNPPKAHKGQIIILDDPLVLCNLVLEFFETLVFEARAYESPAA